MLARAATPGPWQDTRPPELVDYRPIRCVAFGIPADSPRDFEGNDIAFITAANPQTVLRLVAALRAAEQLLNETIANTFRPQTVASLQASLAALEDA